MWKIVLCLIFFSYPSSLSGEEHISESNPAKHTSIDVTNLASLQRGAKYFINFCSGCHSLHFMRYNTLMVDLKITSETNSAIDNQRLSNKLIFTLAEPNDTIKPSLLRRDALTWFGRNPPDLSLVTRARSTDWVYNYLLNFYQDEKRPFGVNNHVVNNTSMPDPFAVLRQKIHPNYQTKNKISYEQPVKTEELLDYSLNASQDQEVIKLENIAADVVNFLAYVAEPSKMLRRALGIKVCAFLMIFLCLVYFLKRQIWKNRPPT